MKKLFVFSFLLGFLGIYPKKLTASHVAIKKLVHAVSKNKKKACLFIERYAQGTKLEQKEAFVLGVLCDYIEELKHSDYDVRNNSQNQPGE